MSNLKNALTRKLGPLPAWAWGAIAGIGLFLYRRNQAAASGGSGGSQQDVPTFYGPYGQDSYPVQGGGGTGPLGDPGGAGTDNGASGPTSQPPTIIVNPPREAPVGSKTKPRKKKAKPQHTRHQKQPPKKPAAKGRTHPKHSHRKAPAPHPDKGVPQPKGTPQHTAPARHPAVAHRGPATRPRTNAHPTKQHTAAHARKR